MKRFALSSKWLVAMSVTFGTLMGTLDGTMVNIALPHIRGNLGASLQEITWAVTGFHITNICIMPLTGFLGRRFGQKRVYMGALVLFLGSSMLCGMAGSLPVLVLCRALQGMGAGALLPTEQAILRRAFPPKEQGMAMAIFSMTVMLGPAAGPTLGGLLVDHLSWQWVFFVNVPIGMCGLVLVGRFVQELEEQQAPGAAGSSVDWAGIVLLLASLTGMQLLLSEGGEWGWLEPGTLALGLAVMLGLLAFTWRELTALAPVVHVRLFQEPVFLRGTLLAGILNAMLMALVFLLPLFMQEVLGFSATEAGMTLLLRVAVSALATPLLGRFYGVLPPQAVLAAGAFFFGLSCYQVSHFTLETEAMEIATTVAIQGIGFSAIHVTLTTLALSRTPKHQYVDASGLHALVRQTGGALGIAAFAGLVEHQSITARAALVPHVIPGRPEVVQHLQVLEATLRAQGLEPGASQGAALGLLQDMVQRQAMVLAFNKSFFIISLLFLVGVLLALTLRKQSHVSEP